MMMLNNKFEIMIDPKELRLGNIVKDSITGEWMVIEELGSTVLAAVINRDKYPLPDGWKMVGVPLTPEILEKCGFRTVKNGVGLCVLEGYVQISWLFQKFPLVVDIDGSRMPLHGIKHLHQLQNLYYSLTGKELEVTL